MSETENSRMEQETSTNNTVVVEEVNDVEKNPIDENKVKDLVKEVMKLNGVGREVYLEVIKEDSEELHNAVVVELKNLEEKQPKISDVIDNPNTPSDLREMLLEGFKTKIGTPKEPRLVAINSVSSIDTLAENRLDFVLMDLAGTLALDIARIQGSKIYSKFRKIYKRGRKLEKRIKKYNNELTKINTTISQVAKGNYSAIKDFSK